MAFCKNLHGRMAFSRSSLSRSLLMRHRNRWHCLFAAHAQQPSGLPGCGFQTLAASWLYWSWVGLFICLETQPCTDRALLLRAMLLPPWCIEQSALDGDNLRSQAADPHETAQKCTDSCLVMQLALALSLDAFFSAVHG